MTSSETPSARLRSALVGLGLFPLPEVVLFPGVLLPLHVFEPRYRKLTEDCLAGSQLMGVVQIVSPEPVDGHGHPTLARVAGVGEIIRSQRLPGGRFNILLRGVCRAGIQELPFEGPYRRADARALETTPSSHPATDLAALVSCLQQARAAAKAAGVELASLGLDSAEDLEPGQLADFLAAALIPDGNERQEILETLDASVRVSKVCGAIAGRGEPGGLLN
ncbi:MAG: LON peptidase substrate-binding domain-containing protein [Myxococcales bacterium]|nr:LON peptidase substrate-binding domain-containing protein [Myxococcales bacterium]